MTCGVPSAQSEVPQTPAAAKYLKKLEEPIILRGDSFKAVLVVYEDFSKRLASNEAAANAAETPDRQLALLMSKIENYDIHVEQTKSSYVVQIGPTLRGDVPLIFGGGARYIIDRQTFAISKKIPLK